MEATAAITIELVENGYIITRCDVATAEGSGARTRWVYERTKDMLDAVATHFHEWIILRKLDWMSPSLEEA